MERFYHKCHFCGGDVKERTMKVDYRWGEDILAVFENVPAGVCEICGEQYMKAEIVKEMERLVQSKEKPKKIIQVPVMDLAANV